ncbi:thiol peroxidase [Hyunsoonleella sp. SJ7]|uniref:Thiol peroxidase n=1 Tax=Hyunsoonleella aquatilis TaxID=2762758 RepID=A0A923HAS0_9FLAO|nr:thiol peroxidase [Hyunsoonleella aquatilis]MBC3759693.1 thiol peroxidase [Hyunsoonleella aquatilis]
MANITLGGTPVETSGSLPKVGTQIKDFLLVATDMSTKSLTDFKGKKLVLNIFPSVNTSVCATSVRQFNTEANELDNTVVLCISRDLPFAQKQFCAAEGLDNVVMLSDFKTGQFGKDYGVMFTSGAFDALLSRSVVVADASGKVLYSEQVPETGEEPNYKAALEALLDE